jgi:hypothetical protein
MTFQLFHQEVGPIFPSLEFCHLTCFGLDMHLGISVSALGAFSDQLD